MMDPQARRRTWLPDDNRMLMGLWDTVGSVMLIALMMGRSASSIQTQASRLGLPPRAEDKNKHRRKWTDEDDDILNEQELLYTDMRGMIDAKAIATSMGRSIDAVLSRLEARYGEDSCVLSRVVIPMQSAAPTVGESPQPLAFRGAKAGEKERQCLRCMKMFWSEGRHNWVCVPCKRSEDWITA